MPLDTAGLFRTVVASRLEAILDGGFTVFAREGSAPSCVNEIAAEAGVAKPAVYSHLSDKANLFRHAMATATDSAMAEEITRFPDLLDVVRGRAANGSTKPLPTGWRGSRSPAGCALSTPSRT